MMHWGYFGGPGFLTTGGGWWLAFAAGRVLFFALIVYAIVKFVNRREKYVTHSDAIRILEERYARGELDETDYVQRKAILKK